MSEKNTKIRKIRTHLTRFAGVEGLTPGMVRLTFEGKDLEEFESLGPAEFLYLLLPPPGREGLTIGRDFTWDGLRRMEESERPIGAYYTVRRRRPRTHEIDLDAVLHGGGDVEEWLGRAREGDEVALWGPRSFYDPPENTDWRLLIADETGIPAAAGILESLPEGAKAQLFVEVSGKEEEQPLPTAGDVDVTWLHRNGVPAGKSSQLIDAVRGMDFPEVSEGEVYVWSGAESREVSEIRKHLRSERGVDKSRMSLLAYWKHTDSPEEEE